MKLLSLIAGFLIVILPAAKVGVAYRQFVLPAADMAVESCSVQTGLPPGLNVARAYDDDAQRSNNKGRTVCEIAGVPLAKGNFTFNLHIVGRSNRVVSEDQLVKVTVQ
jgi:hypothetical protein